MRQNKICLLVCRAKFHWKILIFGDRTAMNFRRDFILRENKCHNYFTSK